MMQHPEKQFSVTWRGKKFNFGMNHGANLKELGDKLQTLTNVKPDTLRLIVPTNKGSKLLYPFSDEHSYLPLEAASTLEVWKVMFIPVSWFNRNLIVFCLANLHWSLKFKFAQILHMYSQNVILFVSVW